MTRATRQLKSIAVCILLVLAGNFLAVPATAASGCLSACCMRDAAPTGGSGRWMAADQGCCCGQAAATPCRLSDTTQDGSTVFTLSWSRHTKPVGPVAALRVVDSSLSATAACDDRPNTLLGPPVGHLTPLYLQHQLFRI